MNNSNNPTEAPHEFVASDRANLYPRGYHRCLVCDKRRDEHVVETDRADAPAEPHLGENFDYDFHKGLNDIMEREKSKRVEAPLPPSRPMPKRIFIRPGDAEWSTMPLNYDNDDVEYIEKSAHEREIAGLKDALRGLYALIENGDLVRDITNDAEFIKFTEQGLRITKAVAAAREKLEEQSNA